MVGKVQNGPPRAGGPPQVLQGGLPWSSGPAPGFASGPLHRRQNGSRGFVQDDRGFFPKCARRLVEGLGMEARGRASRDGGTVPSKGAFREANHLQIELPKIGVLLLGQARRAEEAAGHLHVGHQRPNPGVQAAAFLLRFGIFGKDACFSSQHAPTRRVVPGAEPSPAQIIVQFRAGSDPKISQHRKNGLQDPPPRREAVEKPLLLRRFLEFPVDDDQIDVADSRPPAFGGHAPVEVDRFRSLDLRQPMGGGRGGRAVKRAI